MAARVSPWRPFLLSNTDGVTIFVNQEYNLDMENNTAKHFVLQLGSLVTLYLSISFLIVLVFALISLFYPDATEYYYQLESYSSSVRLGIAMIIVFFPAYLALTRIVNTMRRKEHDASYLGITKWLMYLSLLVGGGVLLGDFVAIIYQFLEGDLTMRFFLKAGFLLLIVGAAFYYYLLDARGYWLKNEQSSLLYAGAVTAVVVTALTVGFFNIETPAQVRDMRLDETQISDLQQIQWKVEETLRAQGTSSLPTSLQSLYGDMDIPVAPEDRAAYSYEVTSTGFTLCATFARDSAASSDEFMGKPMYDSDMPIKNPDNWSHKAGRYCFERIVR